MTRRTKKSSGRVESGRYEIRSGSLSPSIFGNNIAVQAFRLMLKVMKKPVPPLVIGRTPSLSNVSKALVQKSRAKLLEMCKASKKDKRLFERDLVYGEYFPEAILVYAYITMTKGAYLTTKDRILIEEAIAIEKTKSKYYVTAKMRKQRTMQLNHLQNTLEAYKNGVAQDGSTPHGHKIRLFHTERGRKRAQKISREKSKAKKAASKTPKVELTPEERKMWAEVYMMMRVLYPAMVVRKAFKEMCPKLDQKDLIYECRLNGYTDSKDRPSDKFKQDMMGALNNHINVRF